LSSSQSFLQQGYDKVIEATDDDDCLLLCRSIYGLVQAARQWWKYFVLKLKNLDFQKSKIDPCLLFCHNQFGFVILCISVDDVLCIGNKEAIDSAVDDINQVLSIKRTKEVKEYVGCTFWKDEKNNCLFLCQPDLIA
jgi:hypothetical protein